VLEHKFELITENYNLNLFVYCAQMALVNVVNVIPQESKTPFNYPVRFEIFFETM
jgi:hypothetical protein